ncbi:MAG: nucleotide exchange factor GrpE [Planctomycetota bacterium]|nr:nucleotide exchange factor GrpE [Planctomycetota bacterium]MDA1139972.1 nucleotide exchange factor GrpE [Planctomycetota bacterium]
MDTTDTPTAQEASDQEDQVRDSSEEALVAEEADRAEGDPSEMEDETPATPEELMELRQKAAERDDYLNEFQRARADYQNLHRRTQRDRATFRQQGIEDICQEMFLALDQLDLAIQSAESSKEVDALVQGITMVRTTFQSVLQRFNIENILTQDQQFDPNLHEAVSTVNSPDLPDLTILAEVRKGYRMGDRILRPSQVMVSKRPDSE